MLRVILICDLGDYRKEPICNKLEELQEDVLIDEYIFLDTGSKKSQRKARGYLSKYAASEIFVVFEKQSEGQIETDEWGDYLEKPKTVKKTEVVDVLYKEQVNKDTTWEDVIERRLKRLMN